MLLFKLLPYSENAPYNLHDPSKVIKSEYVYDIESNVIFEIPPEANSSTGNTGILATSYLYNTRGQVIEKISPDKGHQYYEYNDDGTLNKIIKADLNQLIFQYDFLGRLSSIYESVYDDQGSYERVIKIYDDCSNVADYLPDIPALSNVLSEITNTRGRLVADIARLSPEEYVIDMFSYNDEGKIGAKYKYIKHASANGLGWQKIAYLLCGV